MVRTWLLVGAGVALGTWACVGTDSMQTDPGSAGSPESAAPYPSELSEANVRYLMQEKRTYSRQLLEYLTDADYRGIARNATALREISLRAEWEVHGKQPYWQHSERFRSVLTELIRHAEAEDAEAVYADYVAMTESCVDCHTWLRGQGLSGALRHAAVD